MLESDHFAYNCSTGYIQTPMNFNVYLDDPTARELNRLAKRNGTTRNAIIRTAVRDWVERRGKKRWSERVLAFRGDPDLVPFEDHRRELRTVTTDPFVRRRRHE